MLPCLVASEPAAGRAPHDLIAILLLRASLGVAIGRGHVPLCQALCRQAAGSRPLSVAMRVITSCVHKPNVHGTLSLSNANAATV